MCFYNNGHSGLDAFARKEKSRKLLSTYDLKTSLTRLELVTFGFGDSQVNMFQNL